MSSSGVKAGLLGVLALAAAGCASVGDRVPAATATTSDHLASTQTFTAPAAAWPGANWWTAYGDTQLSSLIDEGLANSPTLAEAQARVHSANAEVQNARGANGPNVALNASAEEQKQSYNFGIPAAFVPQGYNDYGRATLDFSYEFDFWGRNRSASAAAVSNARAAQAESDEARLTLSTAIAEAYADLARLYAERDIAARSVEVRSETANLVIRRVNAGVDTRGEQRQAEAGVPAARAQVAAIDENINITRNRLAALIGAGPDRGISIQRPQQTTLSSFGLPQNLAADLIGRRPDIVAARWRAEAAQSRVGEARAAFYPNVNLVALIGTQSLGLNNLTRSGSDIGQFGPAISLPIFSAGRLQAGLHRADAERDAAIDQYNATLTEALHQVADAATSQRALDTRLQESQASLAANEDAYRIARLRYNGGLSNYQDVLIVEDALLAQRLAVADLQSRRFTLDVALVRALGGGFTTNN